LIPQSPVRVATLLDIYLSTANQKSRKEDENWDTYVFQPELLNRINLAYQQANINSVKGNYLNFYFVSLTSTKDEPPHFEHGGNLSPFTHVTSFPQLVHLYIPET
jgi:hypothetical protein